MSLKRRSSNSETIAVRVCQMNFVRPRLFGQGLVELLRNPLDVFHRHLNLVTPTGGVQGPLVVWRSK